MKEWNREYRHASKMQKQQLLLENSSRGMSGYGGADGGVHIAIEQFSGSVFTGDAQDRMACGRILSHDQGKPIDPKWYSSSVTCTDCKRAWSEAKKAGAPYFRSALRRIAAEMSSERSRSMDGLAADSSACDDGRCDECEDSDCSCRCHSRYAHCSCGASYTKAEWESLPFVGRVRTISKGHTDPVKVVESRTCRYCHDSAVEEFPA